MPELTCPLCKSALEKTEHTYRCPAGHSFDIAKSGYVNLLPPSAGGKRHGDDKLMVRARADFLNKGYYDQLSQKIAECAERYSGSTVHIADAGCGEGKYTADVLAHLENCGKAAHITGIDISKDALIYAARRSKSLTLCAASCAALPLASGDTDILLNIFSPLMAEEFRRVLKPGGSLIRAIPLKDHLFELKQLIYEKPYENDMPELTLDGFKIAESHELKYRITLEGPDIMTLFKMTPYYYKTGTADQQKAEAAQRLETRVEFGVIVYEKL